MVAKSLHASVRFLIAGFSVLLLLLCFDKLALWGSVGREVRWSLLEGSAAAVAIVFLTPVLMHGDRVQRILALILLIIPVIGLFSALLTAAGYTFDFHL